MFVVALDTGRGHGNVSEHACVQAYIRHIKKLRLPGLTQGLKFFLLQAFETVIGADRVIQKLLLVMVDLLFGFVVAIVSVRRCTALKICANFFSRNDLLDRLLCFHDVVAVKIVTTQAAFPTLESNQPIMRHIQRVFSESGFLVAVHAIAYFCTGDPLPLMFGMAGDAKLRTQVFSGFEEARLKKTIDRMSIIRTFVATQAVFITHVLMAEIRQVVALTERIVQISLNLLA